MLPPGSFLNNAAPSDAALYRQVETDPLLRLRLKHALHLADDKSVIAFAHTLHLQPLSEPKVLRIFYARSTGAWGYKVRRVPAGTLVYAGSDGGARLMQICGNPVETMSPAKLIHPERIARYSPNESDAGLVLQDDTIGQIPFSGNVLAQPEIAAESPVDEVVTAVGGEEQPLIAAGAFSTPAIAIPAAGIPNLLALAPLSALPILGLLNHGSGVTYPVPESTPEPDAVLFAAVTCGLLAFGTIVARRRRYGQLA